ncbi:MAG: hypothetical protein Ct9H300mP13_5880 [Gammaproteobacteria bacterium]|nr:MAG: hypothetical protein Ct9H300mP13_5880 [Gammaproteobacteria bacterium]
MRGTKLRFASVRAGANGHYLQGFHPTATCGAFGAAAAAGRFFGVGVLKNSRERLGWWAVRRRVFDAVSRGGAWNKPFHTGYAAMNGLIAATMAREGFFGTAKALEGQKGGFLNAYAPNPDPSAVVAGLGKHYETMEIAFKPYPPAVMVMLLSMR